MAFGIPHIERRSAGDLQRGGNAGDNRRPDRYARLHGVSDETITGVARLRALERDGKLAFPAVAANDARCKHMFDNPYGTGQTTLTAILALTNVLAAGREFCIVGYGWVGKGLARAAHGLGGKVTVVEIDPVKALTAHMDGFRVAPLREALAEADVALESRNRRGERCGLRHAAIHCSLLPCSA